MKEEVERIKRLVGIDHNRWEQPCTCDKCKNMCKVPCIGTPKDIALYYCEAEFLSRLVKVKYE